MNYSSLREKYPEFLFKSYSIEESETEIKVSYNFETVSLCQFNPFWIFKKPAGKSFKDNKILEKLIFSLGMVELVSYWKATCSPTVKILCGSVSKGEAKWFKKLYFKGLGEFFYINKIEADISSFIEPVQEKPAYEKPSFTEKRVASDEVGVITAGMTVQQKEII